MKKGNFPSNLNFAAPPTLKFLKSLTSQTGILQHTKYGVPHRSFGYSLDDNARALLVAIKYHELFRKKEVLDLAVNYLSFISHAKRNDGFFNNFQTFDHKFFPKISQDGFGECVWALGATIASDVTPNLKLAAEDLFSEIEKNIGKLASPRAQAYSILGFCQILKKEPKNKKALEQLKKLTGDLLNLYEKYHEEGLPAGRQGWHWFERSLAYANHILPAALFAAYQFFSDKKILAAAEDSLAFLEKETHTSQGIPCPIGSDGWFPKGGEKAIFDQQPVEAAYAVLANLAALAATKKKSYYEAALNWFSWFHGNNVKKAKVYDFSTGGCYDSVNEAGVNLNQGAESVICYLLAYLELAKVVR